MRHWSKHILPAGAVALLAAVLAGCGDTSPRAPAIRESGTIAAGTNLALASAFPLCAGVSQGMAVTTTVTGAVIGSGGAVIPVGSVVIGRVVDDQDSVRVAFDSLAVGQTRYPLVARVLATTQSEVAAGAISDAGAPPYRGPMHVRCIPRGGRITIQLTADLPLGGGSP
jgi:hypothetical protein